VDGLSWTSLNDMPDFQAFLELVEKLKAAESPTLTQEAVSIAAEHEATIEAKFVDVAELEATVGIEPENTQDELDVDPFPTEEVPLPPTPIVTNLKELVEPKFTAPDTEEVPFDFPVKDDQTLDAPILDLPAKPTLPTLAHAQDMVDAPGPSFADHPDFPTEEELLILENEEPEDDPLGNQLFASVESDWDTGEDEEELAWVSDKQRGRRVVMGLLLLILVGLTTKLILDRRAQMDSEPTIQAAMTPVTGEEGSAEAHGTDEEASSTDGEGELVEAEAEEEVPTPVVKEEVPAQVVAKAEKPKPPADPEAQARRVDAARQAKAKRGPQPKTVADFVDRGRQAIKEGDYNTARVHYLEAVHIEPQNAAANQGLAFAALKQGDAPFAIEYFCRALKSSAPTSSVAKETRQALNDLNAECP
jgi:hypothetical protein